MVFVGFNVFDRYGCKFIKITHDFKNLGRSVGVTKLILWLLQDFLRFICTAIILWHAINLVIVKGEEVSMVTISRSECNRFKVAT